MKIDGFDCFGPAGVDRHVDRASDEWGNLQFNSGSTLIPSGRAIEVLRWDSQATSLQRIWYSTRNNASRNDIPCTSIARGSHR
jgi:hypothetical protein